MSFSFNVRGQVAEGAKANRAIKATFEKTVRELRRVKGLMGTAGWSESTDADGRAEMRVEDVK